MCAGISAIRVHYDTEDATERVIDKIWHAASTSGTDIRLCLCSNPFAPGSVLAAPLHAELVQRLTALNICVANASEIAAVHGLTALRHLQLGSFPDSGALLFGEGAGNGAQPCQMSSLRTLQLHSIPPAAFFTPGSAAGLRRLQALRLNRCQLPDGCMPAELLRLPALRQYEIFNITGQLFRMPDLRGLSALRYLVVYKGPRMRTIRETSSATLEASLTGRPLCGATGLTRLSLSSTAIDSQECVEAIERLPRLKHLRVDYDTCNEAAFWAAKLQLRGRCNVQPAFKCRLNTWFGDDW